MFSFFELEVVHWDYWRRFKLPLGADIVTVVGPNGSGKTTLLDALRTLLSIQCSSGRDYRRYVRQYESELEGAGLTRAIKRVLALDQGQTDKLCEYSGRQLLELVFNVFGTITRVHARTRQKSSGNSMILKLNLPTSAFSCGRLKPMSIPIISTRH